MSNLRKERQDALLREGKGMELTTNTGWVT